MEEARSQGEAALRHRARRPWSDGSGRAVGYLALSGPGDPAELHHHHHDPAVRPGTQPNACDPAARDLGNVAGRGGCEEVTLKQMLASYPAERMTIWPVDKRVGNVEELLSFAG